MKNYSLEKLVGLGLLGAAVFAFLLGMMTAYFPPSTLEGGTSTVATWFCGILCITCIITGTVVLCNEE